MRGPTPCWCTTVCFGAVTGWLKQRLALLLAHDINLLAYHLPLDAHPALGNNAQLGLLMGWETLSRFGEQDLACLGHALCGLRDTGGTGSQPAHHLGPCTSGGLARPQATFETDCLVHRWGAVMV